MRTLPHTTIAAALAATIASAVHADVTNCFWVSTSMFDYRVVHMPDLDQRRSALANNGANHCVPTASINLFAYAANHGFSWMEPGSGNWQSNTLFNSATAAIDEMGDYMGTSGSSGTGGSGNSAGMTAWCYLHAGAQITTIRRSKSSEYTPTVAKMAQLACQGWMMAFAYGRYEIVGTFGGLPVLDRDGGHACSLTRAKRDSGGYFMLYRDPAKDSVLATQSQFSVTLASPVAYTASFGGTDIRTMNAIGYPSSDGLVRIVDSYWGIRPSYAYSFSNSSALEGGGGGTIRLLDPTPLEGSMNLSLPEIALSSFTTLEDMAFHPDMTSGLVLTRSVFAGQPSLLRSLDLMTGQLTTLPDAPEDLVELAPSDQGFIYSFDAPGKLYKLNADGSISFATSAVPEPSSVSYDNVTDRLSLVSVPDRRIVKLDAELSIVENFIVPTSVPMSGDAMVRVDPTTGRSWFKTAASTLLFNIGPGAAGPTVITITPTSTPGGLKSFQFGSEGQLYLMGESGIKVMKKTGPTSWTADPTNPFHNLPGGSMLMMVQNSTNDEPIHDTLAWKNIHVDELIPLGTDHPDCDADHNGDDLVDGADLGLLLGNWGQTNGVSDINQDGTVDGADLGLLLGAWGNCP